MPIQNLLAKLRVHQKKERDQSETGYRDLVATLADGREEPSADVAANILDAAGKTPDDLATEVGLVLRRRELRVAIEQEPELVAEARRLEKTRAEIKATVDETYRKAALKDEATRERLQRVQSQLSTIARQRAELAQISPSSNERWRIEKQEGAVSLRRGIEEATGELKRLRSQLAKLHGRNEGIEIRTPEFVEVEREAQQVEGQIARLEEELKGLRERDAAIRLRAESAENEAFKLEMTVVDLKAR